MLYWKSAQKLRKCLLRRVGKCLRAWLLPPKRSIRQWTSDASWPSIGHELTADALVMGFGKAIQAYKAVLGGRTAA